MNKLLSVLCGLFLLGACIPSDRQIHAEDPVIIPEDTIYVACDSSQHAILYSLVQVYEALNPLKKVVTVYAREKKLFDYIRTDTVDLILRSYPLTNGEQKELARRHLNPKVHPFWSDGLALIAPEQFPKDRLKEEELRSLLTTGASKDLHVIIDHSHTATYDVLASRFQTAEKLLHAYAGGTEDSVIQAVRTRGNYLGIVGSSHFAGYKKELPPGIKLLGIVPEGKKNPEYPFQDQLYNGVYPLARQLYGINVGAMDGSGSAFASFVLSERGQRIILKAGLLPAKIPPRTIEIVTE